MILCLSFLPPAMVLAVLTISLTAVSCGQADPVILNDAKAPNNEMMSEIDAALEQKKISGKPFRVLFLGESIHKKPLFEMFKLEDCKEPSNTSIENLVQYVTTPLAHRESLEIFDSQIFDKANSFDQVRLRLLLYQIIARYKYIDCIFLAVSAKWSDDETKKIQCPFTDDVMKNVVVVYHADKRDDPDLIRVEGKAGSTPAFQLVLKEPSHRDSTLLNSVLYAISSLPPIDESKQFEDDSVSSLILSTIRSFFPLSKMSLSAIVAMVVGWFLKHPSSLPSFPFWRSEAPPPVPEECKETPPPSGAASLSSFWALFVLLFPLFG